MRKVGVSLCILAHNRIAETANLIGSLKGWQGIDLEICIADQESESAGRLFAFKTADKFCDISDNELWNNGFGWAKQKIVSMASNNWVIIGDPGEVWHETTAMGECSTLLDAIRIHNSVPAFRTYYGDSKRVQHLLEGRGSSRHMHGDICRIFDKRKMRVSGYIHEAPVHIETGSLWAGFARKYKSVGVIEHVDSILDIVPGRQSNENSKKIPEETVYMKRKRVLYDHLLHKIVMNPKLRHGTDFRWWTAHWTTVVAPRFEETSFEKWKAIGG